MEDTPKKEKLYSILRSVGHVDDDEANPEVFEMLLYKANQRQVQRFLEEHEEVSLYPEDLIIVEVRDFTVAVSKYFSTTNGGATKLTLEIKE